MYKAVIDESRHSGGNQPLVVAGIGRLHYQQHASAKASGSTGVVPHHPRFKEGLTYAPRLIEGADGRSPHGARLLAQKPALVLMGCRTMQYARCCAQTRQEDGGKTLTVAVR